MLLLVVLLAQVAPPLDDRPPISPCGDIAGLHKTWENLNLACRKAPQDSSDGEAICLRRDVLGWQLGQLGWCVRNESASDKVGDVPSKGLLKVGGAR